MKPSETVEKEKGDLEVTNQITSNYEVKEYNFTELMKTHVLPD